MHHFVHCLKMLISRLKNLFFRKKTQQEVTIQPGCKMSQLSTSRQENVGTKADLKYLAEKIIEQAYIESLLKDHELDEVAEQMLCYKQSGTIDSHINILLHPF